MRSWGFPPPPLLILIRLFPAAVDLRARGAFTRGTGLVWEQMRLARLWATARTERHLRMSRCLVERMKDSVAVPNRLRMCHQRRLHG